jgi:hypothetical protein
MKSLRLFAVTIMITASIRHVRAAEMRDGGLHGELRKMCDGVCELKAQDSAFSLLMEVYRQFQAYQIESDYQVRLQQANTLTESRGSLVIESSSKGMRTLRQFVATLAAQERDLRLEELETRCANFHSAYACARKIDEDYAGEKVPSVVNERAAAQKLKDYCIITPGALAQGTIRSAGCVPASAMLLDAPRVAPDCQRVVETCE